MNRTNDQRNDLLAPSYKKASRSTLVGFSLLIAVVTTLLPDVGQAAVFNISDGDVAGLIAAINTANSNGEADTINLAAGGTYTLTAIDNADNGLPIITSKITINGSGATIQRSSAAGTPNFRILRINAPTGDLTLNELIIRGGRTVGSGGGIFVHTGGINIASTRLTLVNSTVSGNTATTGGGIDNEGTLTLVNSTVSFNTVTGSGDGGCIRNIAGVATLTNSTVSGNTAPHSGGGIQNFATLTLTNSTVSGNTAGVAGGGMRNFATLTLVNSTVSGNTAPFGGGIYNNGTLTLKNTIVANNSPTDCGGVITSLGHNIVSDGSCGLAGSGDMNSTDPLLDILAGNGGPTQTHALLSGSPAIDAVPLADCTDADGNPITTDQRGVARPQGTACDIGAYEVEAEITVAIDIKPGSFPNSINPQSKGVIPVAILTTGTFDATTVDPTTVLFGPTGTEAAPVHSALADVDEDGDTDMILHFNTQGTGIVCGDTSASLTGETSGGEAIEGSDSINTVGCK